VKRVDKEPQALLEGILTSPLGTVHFSNGVYYVYALRSPNTHQRTKTLTIEARWVEDEFRKRLLDRIDSTNYEQMLYNALASVQAHNAQALVSVDEQVANYQQTIADRQAVMAALGTKIDKPTAEQYNEDILNARANLAALVAKKKEASAEEQDLRDLCTELWNFRNHGKKTNEKLQRFIRLATDVVSISEEDERDLARLYPAADRLELLQRFYTKTWICIMDRAKSKGIERNTRLNSSGIIGPSLSLADWDLLQKYGWKREKGAHWLIDVPTSECDDLPTLS